MLPQSMEDHIRARVAGVMPHAPDVVVSRLLMFATAEQAVNL